MPKFMPPAAYKNPQQAIEDEEAKHALKSIQSHRSTEITFRLSKHLDGAFPGLWELAIMKSDGTIDEVISDADMLQYCLDNLHQVLENKGL